MKEFVVGGIKMNNKYKRNIVLSVILIVVIAVSLIVNIHFKNQNNINGLVVGNNIINIGVLTPLTGKGSGIGNDIKNAIELASNEMGNKKINFIYEDTKCDPKEAITGYHKLVDVYNVKMIIGAVCSSSTLSVAPLAEKDKVILITPASSADKISEAGDYIFRDHVLINQKIGRLAEFADERFNRIGIIYDKSNDAYVNSVGIFNNKTDKVVGVEGFQNNENDFKTELAKIKEEDPDVIFIGALMPEAAIILREIKEMGIEADIIMDDGPATDDSFLKSVGNLSNGIFFSGTRFSRESSPNFWNDYNKNFGKDPNIFAAQAYETAKMLSYIVGKCSDDTECIKNELYNINFSGVTGNISFDKNGDARKDIVIKEIVNGTFVFVE